MAGRTIAVFGATGSQGGAVVRSLLARGGYHVVALTRRPEGRRARALADLGVEVRRADLLEPDSLSEALRGASGVFGVTQPWSRDYRKVSPRKEVAQGTNLVDACVERGVEHLVLSTAFVFDREHTGIPHIDSKLAVERHARERAVPCTVLRPASFMDNIGRPFFPVGRYWVRGFVDGATRVPYIACRDIGEVAAIVLGAGETHVGATIDLIGDFVTGRDLARELRALRGGGPFFYVAIPRLPMRLFAREFYSMRLAFERIDRPPYADEVLEAIERTRALHPDTWSLARYLRAAG